MPMFTVRQGIGLSSSFFSERDQEQQQLKPWWKQQQRSVVGFASIGAPSSGAPSAAAPLAFSFAPPLPRGKREPRTGTEFASELCHGQKKACPVLTGVGVRSKRLLGLKNVDVYSLGFYVDPATIKGNGSSGRSSSSSSDQLVANIAADAAVAKTLRIVVTTGMLTASRFVGGVRESLAPALAMVGAGASMGAFEALFEGLSLPKGTELVFSNVPSSGALRVRVGGKEVGSVSDRRFAPALFGLYFGPDSVSPSGRDDIKAGIEKGFGGGGGRREE